MILKVKDSKGNWVDIPAIVGKDGYTPIKGVDYFDGEDGYTPQKGVDYFDGEDGKDYILTAADKQEIANLISLSIVDGEEVEY